MRRALQGVVVWCVMMFAGATLVHAQICAPSGDVNGDGLVSPTDALRAFQHFLGIANLALEPCEQERANVLAPDESGITPGDALCILQHFLGQPSCLDSLPPIANAGTDQAVMAGSLVVLDGSASRDPNSNPLVFQWTLTVRPAGSSATLSNATDTAPTFTADVVGNYEIALVVRDGNQESPPDTVTIQASAEPPTITDFTPASAPIGTLVTVTGRNFLPATGAGSPVVTLRAQNGRTMTALVSRFDASSLAFVIPSGAASGPLTVTVAGSSTTSPTPLTIVPSSRFTLAAMPENAMVIQGQSVSYALTLQSTTAFPQLAALTVTGLPEGVTATLKPPQIAAGQTALLTLTAASDFTPAIDLRFTVSAEARVDGIRVTEPVDLAVTVYAGTTLTLVDGTRPDPFPLRGCYVF